MTTNNHIITSPERESVRCYIENTHLNVVTFCKHKEWEIFKSTINNILCGRSKFKTELVISLMKKMQINPMPEVPYSIENRNGKKKVVLIKGKYEK